MGNSSTVNTQAAAEYLTGRHELYFKVIVWLPHENEGLDERWGLEIKDTKSGVLIAYYEYEAVQDVLIEKKLKAHYRPRQDKDVITGTLKSSITELRELAERVRSQKTLRMGSSGLTKYMDPQVFVTEILNHFGLSKVKTKGSPRLGIDIEEEGGARMSPRLDLKLGAFAEVQQTLR